MNRINRIREMGNWSKNGTGGICIVVKESIQEIISSKVCNQNV